MTNESPAGNLPAAEDDCPDYTFPLAEPDYTSKLPRDLDAFDSALGSLTAERVAELDVLIGRATILDLQALLDAGQTSSLELVSYYVNRIARYDVGKLNSILRVNQAALETAAALDAERAAGAARGPLHGIPVLLKDNIATADMLTTAGAYALGNWQPSRDAFLAGQLRAAGAIILGKANLSEFANYTDPCTPNGFSTLGGQTQNPHGPFDPLGSSSGSAVAVAAGLVVGSVGTETQGSIIMPALANGVVGLKTSLGLVSRDGIVPLLEPQDVPGPIARTVTDVALLLGAMVGLDANDPATTAAASLGDSATAEHNFLSDVSLIGAQAVRVGVPVFPPETVMEPDRYASLGPEQADRAAALLIAQGVPVRRIDIAELDSMPRADLLAVLPYGFREGFDTFMAQWGDAAVPSTLAEVAALNSADPANRAPYGQRFVVGAAETDMTAETYAEITAANRASTQQAIRALLAKHDVDVLLVPPRFQQFAAAGFPALALPDGLDENGRPRGFVLTGDYLSEPQLLAVGYALEQMLDGLVMPGAVLP